MLNYLDRQVLALTAERIIGEFHITKEDFGRIISAFRYAYAFFQISGGWVVDARGPFVVFPLAVAVWSLAGIATSFTRSIWSLTVMRFMLGIGEAFNWPCALKVTQRLLPPRERALGNGIFNSGAAAGAIIAPGIRHAGHVVFRVAIGLLDHRRPRLCLDPRLAGRRQTVSVASWRHRFVGRRGVAGSWGGF